MTDKKIIGIILLGGGERTTRFRPLGFDIPLPLFPIAGIPMIEHHISSLASVNHIQSIFLLGSYQQDESFLSLLSRLKIEYKISIHYLQEYRLLGTAGGLYHFRDEILATSPDLIFVLNADIASDFPLFPMLEFHLKLIANGGSHHTIMGQQASRDQASQFGVFVKDEESHEVLHYVEKPDTYVSSTINCGIYLFSPQIFSKIKDVKNQILNNSPVSNDRGDLRPDDSSKLSLERDIIATLAGSGQLFVFTDVGFWSQIKTAGSAIHSNRLYLRYYQAHLPFKLSAESPQVTGEVIIHPSASISETALIGPNAVIGQNCIIGDGVRVRDSILLDAINIDENSCIINAIIGSHCRLGRWSRIEGVIANTNPNDQYAVYDSFDMFNEDGQLVPNTTVLGARVTVADEVHIRNCIIMPNKEIRSSAKNEVIL